jgi:transposase
MEMSGAQVQRVPQPDAIATRARPAADRASDGGINRLKQWRGTATRFDKRAVNYRAGVVIDSLLWLA